jgi:hypothetical protein
MKLQNSLVILSAWLLVACQGQVTPDVSSGTTNGALPPSSASATQDYLLDFSKGTFKIGYRRNYWLSFDFGETTQTYLGPTGPSNGKFAPNVASTQTVGSYCQSGLAAPAETYAGLEPGESAWVDHVEVEMAPLQGEPAPANMCFGYRDPDGTWHWKLDPNQPTWDSAKGRFRMSFPVQKGPVAGFAILTGDGPFLQLEKIVIAAKKDLH